MSTGSGSTGACSAPTAQSFVMSQHSIQTASKIHHRKPAAFVMCDFCLFIFTRLSIALNVLLFSLLLTEYSKLFIHSAFSCKCVQQIHCQCKQNLTLQIKSTIMQHFSLKVTIWAISHLVTERKDIIRNSELDTRQLSTVITVCLRLQSAVSSILYYTVTLVQGSCPFVKIKFKDFSRTIRRIYKENSGVRIFEISNRIVTSVFDSIRFETSTNIRNFRILTVTNFLLI